MLLDFKHGQLLSAERNIDSNSERGQTTLDGLQDRKLYDHVWSWNDIIAHLQAGDNDTQASQEQAKWLQQMLPGSHIV